jgi:hypothetical protein
MATKKVCKICKMEMQDELDLSNYFTCVKNPTHSTNIHVWCAYKKKVNRTYMLTCPICTCLHKPAGFMQYFISNDTDIGTIRANTQKITKAETIFSWLYKAHLASIGILERNTMMPPISIALVIVQYLLFFSTLYCITTSTRIYCLIAASVASGAIGIRISKTEYSMIWKTIVWKKGMGVLLFSLVFNLLWYWISTWIYTIIVCVMICNALSTIHGWVYKPDDTSNETQTYISSIIISSIMLAQYEVMKVHPGMTLFMVLDIILLTDKRILRHIHKPDEKKSLSKWIGSTLDV